LVERLYAARFRRRRLTSADRELLEAYADPPPLTIEDTLDSATRECVQVITGCEDVGTPERALLAAL
jgi:hypothetical protein